LSLENILSTFRLLLRPCAFAASLRASAALCCRFRCGALCLPLLLPRFKLRRATPLCGRALNCAALPLCVAAPFFFYCYYFGSFMLPLLFLFFLSTVLPLLSPRHLSRLDRATILVDIAAWAQHGKSDGWGIISDNNTTRGEKGTGNFTDSNLYALCALITPIFRQANSNLTSKPDTSNKPKQAQNKISQNKSASPRANEPTGKNKIHVVLPLCRPLPHCLQRAPLRALLETAVCGDRSSPNNEN
jgi:hypothetical protein